MTTEISVMYGSEKVKHVKFKRDINQQDFRRSFVLALVLNLEIQINNVYTNQEDFRIADLHSSDLHDAKSE